MRLTDAIKKCAEGAIMSEIPCDMIIGEVEDVSPYKIRAGEMLLEGDVLLISDGLLPKKAEIKIGDYTRTIVINEGLHEGDAVALIRSFGGQKYAAVAKIAEDVT